MSEWIRELVRHRELLYFLVWRDLKVRYKQTLLGVSWAILQPVLAMVIFSVIFGRLAKMPSDNVPYPLFVYPGLVAWTFFSNAVNQGGMSLSSNANLLTKVYFPRATIPLASVLGVFIDALVAATLIAGMMLWYDVAFSWRALIAIPMLMLLVLCAMGISLTLSAINVKYRDIKYATPFLVQIWMFLTPVIYPVSIVPENLRPLLALNPVTGVVEGIRAAILPGKPIDWDLLGISALVSVIMVIVGVVYFRREERGFADVI